MENEYKFQVTIVPEDYDYGEEEIVYRIYLNEQLISERSLPILKHNQAITDNFVINLCNTSKEKIFSFENIKRKKATVEKLIINDFSLNKNTKVVAIAGLRLYIKLINNIEEIFNGL